MRHRRPSAVVAVAGSSGGLAPIRALVSGLPASFPAAVVIVTHSGSRRSSALPTILSGAGPLPACHPDNGQPLEAARIFVAPPDRHLVVEQGGSVQLTRGPKENLVRPAADVLFRSVARVFGPRAIGVVLSGDGRDGAAGLAEIRAAGGLAVVQAPSDAPFPSMPSAALAAVTPDAIVPSASIAGVVDRLVRSRLGAGAAAPPPARAHRGRRARAMRRGLRILVVEDNHLLASAIVGMLGDLQCTAVGPVLDLHAALRALEEQGAGRVDCAVLDADVRGETVYPLASALRERGIPLVFATGRGAGALREPWCWYAALVKPFDGSALRDALRKALRTPRPAPGDAAAFIARPNRDPERPEETRNLATEWQTSLGDASGRVKEGTRTVAHSGEMVEQSRDIVARTREVIERSRGRARVAERALRAWRAGR